MSGDINQSMGRIFAVELDGRVYGCKSCNTHLALSTDLISRGFYCHRGKAYLFNNVVNFTSGEVVERMMLSGMHTVTDIFCCRCGQIIGWKYETVQEKSQKYKEGKFVLERGRIVDEIGFSTEFCVEGCVSMSDTEDD